MYVESKRVRVWTESKQVMMATVGRGWKTLVLGSKSHELADEWSRKGVSWESQIAQNYLKKVERFVTSSDYAYYEAIEKWCGNWLFVIDEI
ncbi:unnamed protein product [Malus baccata var. baccata]